MYGSLGGARDGASRLIRTRMYASHICNVYTVVYCSVVYVGVSYLPLLTLAYLYRKYVLYTCLQSTARSSKKLLRTSQTCGGGSLPNVNNIASRSNSPSSGSFIKVNSEYLLSTYTDIHVVVGLYRFRMLVVPIPS